ncbi:MAG TPA: RluA family pseudouridine synthase [Thermoanaerobaculia bacterium]|nr:RluA family pseudouridine synthase [Thermoanaerobaculia bacterium]
MRLDQAVALRFAISRRKARERIAAGRVLVNQRLVRVASREVADDDELRIADELPAVSILAIHEDWIAVDKPVGMPVQPPRDRSAISLEEILRVEYREIYLVHRLDTPTSGAVVFARNRAAAARLSALFASRAIRKTYLAVVDGTPSTQTIDSPIDGKEAITIVRPREDGLVEAEILTGRTHQIRIHLASIGHAVLGDRRYGGPPAPRLMLHAWKLEHGELGTVVAPPPAEFGIGSPR